jgi:hypothetical protein
VVLDQLLGFDDYFEQVFVQLVDALHLFGGYDCLLDYCGRTLLKLVPLDCFWYESLKLGIKVY